MRETELRPSVPDGRNRLGLILVAVLLAVPFVVGADPLIASIPLMALIVHSYVSIRLAMTTIAQELRLVTLMWWMFFYWFFGVVALNQLTLGVYAEPSRISVDEANAAFWIVALFVSAFDVAAAVAYRTGRRRVKMQFPRLPRRAAHNHRRTLLQLTIGSIGLTGVVALAVGISTILFSSRSDLSTALGETGGYLMSGLAGGLIVQTAFRVPILVSLLALIFERRRRGHWIVRKKVVLWGAAALAVSIWPLSVPRYWLGTALLALLFVAAPPARATRRAALVVLVLLTLAFAFPVADVFRRDVSADAVVAELTATGRSFWASRDWDAFQMSVDAFQLRDQVNTAGGGNLIGALLFWIPRSIWNSKPEPTGRLVARAAGRRFERVSMPLVAESYIAFGVLGVLGMGIVIGAGVGRLEFFGRDPTQPQWLPHCTAAAYVIFLLRGALLSAVAYGTPLLVLVWIVHRIVGMDAENSMGKA